MNLKLAEYNLKDGKFLRFLELGQQFVYGGDWLGVLDKESKLDIATQMSMAASIGDINPIKYTRLDKTDPLNRFNGLFDGRSFGQGKFVLVSQHFYKEYPKGYIKGDVVYIMEENNETSMSIGGLHQSSQLFKELNND